MSSSNPAHNKHIYDNLSNIVNLNDNSNANDIINTKIDIL